MAVFASHVDPGDDDSLRYFWVLANRLIQVRRENAAIVELRSYGAAVYQGYELSDGSLVIYSKSKSPLELLLLSREEENSAWFRVRTTWSNLRTSWLGDRRPRAVRVTYNNYSTKLIQVIGYFSKDGDNPNFTGLDARDEHLAPLLRLPTLRNIHLVDAEITDEALMTLAALEKLEFLDLRGASVSQKAVDSLQKKLPHCQIKTGPSLDLTSHFFEMEKRFESVDEMDAKAKRRGEKVENGMRVKLAE